MWPGDSQSVRRRRDTRPRQGSKMFLLLIQLTTLTDYYHRRSVAWPGDSTILPEGTTRLLVVSGWKEGKGESNFVSGFSCPPQVHI